VDFISLGETVKMKSNKPNDMQNAIIDQLISNRLLCTKTTLMIFIAQEIQGKSK
jgi:hypothetical protein